MVFLRLLKLVSIALSIAILREKIRYELIKQEGKGDG